MKLIALGMIGCWLVIGAAASGLAVQYRSATDPTTNTTTVHKNRPALMLYRNVQDI